MKQQQQQHKLLLFLLLLLVSTHATRKYLTLKTHTYSQLHPGRTASAAATHC
jgi:hypothetical protein